MIQRIQSLLLFASCILLIIFLFVPIWKKEEKTLKKSFAGINPKKKVVLTAFNATYYASVTDDQEEIVDKKGTPYIAIIAILSALVALYSIFQFKNRLLQIKLGFFNSLLMSGILGAIFAGMNVGNQLIHENGVEEFQIGFFVPAITLFLNLLANRYIRKDENLVRSADRIR